MDIQTKPEKNKNFDYSFSDNLDNITFQYSLKSIDFEVTTPSNLLFFNYELAKLLNTQSLQLDNYLEELSDLSSTLKYDFLYDNSSELSKKCNILARSILIALRSCICKRMQQEQHLYLMQNEEGLIKIGISKEPEKRRKTLERELQEKIHILKVLDTDKSVYELELHNIFKKFNAFHKGGKEWFVPYPELIKWVDNVNDKNFYKLHDKLKNKD
jgi:hypothetical protein